MSAVRSGRKAFPAPSAPLRPACGFLTMSTRYVYPLLLLLKASWKNFTNPLLWLLLFPGLRTAPEDTGHVPGKMYEDTVVSGVQGVPEPAEDAGGRICRRVSPEEMAKLIPRGQKSHLPPK